MVEDEARTALIEQTAQALEQMPAGSRGWFWWSAAADVLLVSSFQADPRREHLQQRVASVVPASPAQAGVLLVDKGGRCSFVSLHGTEETLGAVARWAVKHHSDFPALARLREAAWNQVDAQGVLQARYGRKELWKGLPRTAIPGTIRAAARTLADLSTGEDFWFCLGLDDQQAPFLLLLPVADDPDGAAFSQHVRALRLRAQQGVLVQGVGQRASDGAPLLTTTGSGSGWQDAVEALLGHHALQMPPLRAFAQAQLVRLKQKGREQPVKSRTEPFSPARNLLPHTEILARLQQEGGKARLWMCAADAEGQVRLLLADADEALKAAAQQIQVDGKTLRGILAFSAAEGWTLRLRRPEKDATLWLQRWIQQAQPRWPALLTLNTTQVRLAPPKGES